MKVVKIESLYRSKYTATLLNAIKQKWTSGYVFDCMGEPKRQHLMLYFINCSAVYTLKDGRELVAPRNSVVYTPEGCEYRVRFTDCDHSGSYNAVGINFKLYDEEGLPFRLHDDVKIYTLNRAEPVSEGFHRIAEEGQRAVYSPMKATGLFYVLLSDIGSYYHTKHNVLPKYNVIARGINMLESTDVYDLKVNDIARECNVSPIYFRKLFKEYSGMTPIDYRLNAVINQAKQHLIYSDRSVSEISDMLKFSSTTYFCRAFKKKTGLTPMEYVKKHSGSAVGR